MSTRRLARSRSVLFAFASLSLAATLGSVAPACSSSAAATSAGSTSGGACNDNAGLSCSPGTCASPGKPAPGPKDTHCGTTVQVTSQKVCDWDGGGVDPGTTSATTGSGGSGGKGGAAGAPGTGGKGGNTSGNSCDDSSYGATMYGYESDDDDCKYHVTWSSTPICEKAAVTFTVKATHKTDGTPLTGAEPFADVSLNCSSTNPNGPCACTGGTGVPITTEPTPGTYSIGPVFFDKPGKWQVRFHFNHECTDFSPESPHGHAAYWVDVP